MDFVNYLQDLVDTSIFKYTFVGGKILAFAILAGRFFSDLLSKNLDNSEGGIRKESIVMLFGGAFIIFSSDWVINSIEMAFNGLSTKLNAQESNIYTNLDHELEAYENEIWENATFFYDYIVAFFEHLSIVFAYLIALAIALFAKLSDLVVTATYLVQRLFILNLLKMFFPICVAFSTHPKLDNLFYGWIKSYIGVFMLGIGYIGIIAFCNLIPKAIMSAFKNSHEAGIFEIPMALISTVVLTVAIKIGLFKFVTQYVYGFFR